MRCKDTLVIYRNRYYVFLFGIRNKSVAICDKTKRPSSASRERL